MFVQLSEIFLLLCGRDLSSHDSRILSLCIMHCANTFSPFTFSTASRRTHGLLLLVPLSLFIFIFFGAKIGMQLNRFCFVGLFQLLRKRELNLH